MSTTTATEEHGTISRVRIWIAIGAGAVTIGGGALALAGAHGDLLHRLDRVEARVAETDAVRARLDDMRERLGEIGAELGLVRRWFRIPDPPPAPALPGMDAPGAQDEEVRP